MPTNQSERLDDNTKAQLKAIVDKFSDEDRAVRDRQIRQWRRLKMLWENIQHAYYSETAHDWRVPDTERSGEESDQGYYDKPVNIFRAYLESIIAALSVTIPPIVCYPDDADNPLDVTTAKAGDKIVELVFKHNNAPLLWLHALFIYCTEGMTAMYTYPDASEEYGTYEQKKYEEDMEQHELSNCPDCGYEMGDQVTGPNAIDSSGQPTIQPQIDPMTGQPLPPSIDQQEQQYQTQHQDEFNPQPPPQPEYCQGCGQLVIPNKQQSNLVVTRLVGITKHPKTRVCMEAKGGLFIKIPVWARNQKECTYLIDSYETHYANVIEMYPELRGKVERSGHSSYDMYEEWGRISPQYRGEKPIDNVTVRNCWLRPAAFNTIDEDEGDKLRKKYPDGVKVCVVNDQIAHAENQALDDYWTIVHNPLSDYLHFDPLGLLLTSVQDITNDLVSLVVQTIEHGIPQTFADPKVLNFNSYRNSEVIPGGIYPATPKSGKALSEGFYEVKTATLSQEILPFAQKIQEMGQLVSGALPSLFGGQMSGSRTASEYSMSRNQALQRLQTTWKMLTLWWKDVFGKVIPMYISEMKDDEKQVKKDEMGNFINVFVRRAELEGKIGSIELEANENLPITWNQQKDSIMELFKLNNDQVMQTLTSPENMPYLKRAIGLTDYIIPGEDDRQKQYEEIQLLVNSEPIQMPPDPNQVMQAQQMGMPPPQPQMLPSIDIDIDVDNHQLESDICRRWLVADAGRLCKMENPAGYQNVLLHMKAHADAQQQQQMNLQQQQLQLQMQQAQIQAIARPQQGQKSTGQQLGADQNEPTVQ